MRQIVKPGAAFQALYQGVVRIDFEYRLGVWRRLPSLLEHARQMPAHVTILDDQTRCRVHKPGADADILGAIFECLFEAIERGLESARGLLGLLLFGLVLQFAQVHRALGNALKRFAVELKQVAEHPLVHPVGE